MKAILDIFDSFEVVGQEHCEVHDRSYDLIKTPAGIAGGCEICHEERRKIEDQEIVMEAIKHKKDWQQPYIERFERVSSDLEVAKVNNYKPNHKTQEQAKKMVIDYIKHFNKKGSLILSGRAGNGKSHLAYAITKALRQRKFKTLFIKSTDLLDLIKTTYQPGAQLTEDRIFEVIETIDLLVLDDLGSEYVRGNEQGHETWASDILYKVMDLRLNKSLVCTTNYTEKELESKYGYNGERIISRMMDNARATRLQGEDHRRKNRF